MEEQWPVDSDLQKFCRLRHYDQFNFDRKKLIERLAELYAPAFYDQSGMLRDKATEQPLKVTKFDHLLLEEKVNVARCYMQTPTNGARPAVWYSRKGLDERVDVCDDFESEYAFVIRAVFSDGMLSGWEQRKRQVSLAPYIGKPLADVLLYLVARGLIAAT